MKIFLASEKPTLYQLIVKRQFDDAKEKIIAGEKIPDFLYLQVTNHDDLDIFKFLLEFGDKESPKWSTSMVVWQGAVQCLNYLFDQKIVNYSADLMDIKPRKNAEKITQILVSQRDELENISPCKVLSF